MICASRRRLPDFQGCQDSGAFARFENTSAEIHSSPVLKENETVQGSSPPPRTRHGLAQKSLWPLANQFACAGQPGKRTSIAKRASNHEQRPQENKGVQQGPGCIVDGRRATAGVHADDLRPRLQQNSVRNLAGSLQPSEMQSGPYN